MRTLASIVAIGAGAYAFTASMDRKTKKRWKKRISSVDLSMFEDLMPEKRTMKRMRKQMNKAFS
ncbi:hypothetical protein CR194_01105 [Salipaludibacillus keqinensis]|uniref:DUF3918 domain-containing protein n=1 Tax=Salipaludibacillus keqinensis TaxID=2045207 RepID=A0A323TIZ3_9BACI|nr:hypothetical protein [Salipaludibacillus keqinensis]PYZ94166.1 hypothetical protein CR194_01105 [Salipaludibacillus keqinensis]